MQGIIHYDDKRYFEAQGERRFDLDRIMQFCREQGMAFYDTATKVCRLKDNASDNFLEILEPTDVFALLAEIPLCHTIITTGGKASDELASYFAGKGIPVDVPKVGEYATFCVPRSVFDVSPSAFNITHSAPTSLTWWRMPSTSRAYPMKLEKKASFYRRLSDL